MSSLLHQTGLRSFFLYRRLISYCLPHSQNSFWIMLVWLSIPIITIWKCRCVFFYFFFIFPLCKCQKAIEVSDNSGMQMCFWCFLGAVAESTIPPLVWIWGIKTYSPYSLCFFCSCQINIAQGDYWFSFWETKMGFLFRGFDVRCKLRWQRPGSVCGNNASVQRRTQTLIAHLFLEIQNSWAHKMYTGIGVISIELPGLYPEMILD